MQIDFVVWGMGGAVATTMIVTLLKTLFPDVIKDRSAVIAAVVTGFVLAGLSYGAQITPAVETVLQIVGAGLLAGLSACGIYSVTKKR